MAAIALFEAARHWLLYGDIANYWGHSSSITPYLTRGSSLRAIASTGHSLALGFQLVIVRFRLLALPAVICRVAACEARDVRLAILGSARGLFPGPLDRRMFLYFVYAVLRPHPISGLMKAFGTGLLLAVVVARHRFATRS